MSTTIDARRVEAFLNVLRSYGTEGASAAELSARTGLAQRTVRTRIEEARDALAGTDFVIVATGKGVSSRYVLTNDRDLIDAWVNDTVKTIENLAQRVFDHAPDANSKAAAADALEAVIAA